MGWLNKLFNIEPNKRDGSVTYGNRVTTEDASVASARNRLKLVLMHDRTQLSPEMMEKMRDELVEVISKYVEIDNDALDINLESESNTIALVANIPVVRAKVVEDGVVKHVTASSTSSETKTGTKDTTSTTTPKTKKKIKKTETPQTKKETSTVS